jgi:futalosine hydrolase
MIRILQMDHSGVLIVVAHHTEAKAIYDTVNSGSEVYEILTTGVGGMNMAWSLQKRLTSGPKPNFIIGTGIAGSYLDTIRKGDVVLAASDCFADMGIDDNGQFITLFSKNLADPDVFPFSGGKIVCRNKWHTELSKYLRIVEAATVNMASGSEQVIARIKMVWNPAIETMEGAYFSYVCAMSGIPYISLRAVSNMIEPRNERNWDIALALRNLTELFPQVLKIIEEK